ncbi:N-6 adenine-specific DNA methylase [Klebsormidium nitens]|uniref:Protein-lysine N-methyltransferase KFL_004280020 n=1 Tax=Klebsormidium nitens TaxID=105231 RepID=A0A1Y1ICW0_KLENI|nr:N-6 adenine-specific DNA methylase [Klebsormidium nitens]|eukprot:GAQ88433.1 N-6 adenine-specific DNA methylase [Klebsormidium nitens]
MVNQADGAATLSIPPDAEDDTPLDVTDSLSGSTLAALQEFLAEQKQAAENAEGDPFAEDWGLSQFWYTRETAHKVAEEVVEKSDGGRQPIACVACPSLFRELKASFPEANVHLFEFDNRFSSFGSQFTFYDYNKPVRLPAEQKGHFQVVVADPPYLSDECIQKTAQTVEYLSCSNASRLILTGAVQRDRVWKYLGMRPCVFRPEHQKKLGNEFLVYTNYEACQRLGGWDKSLIDP